MEATTARQLIPVQPRRQPYQLRRPFSYVIVIDETRKVDRKSPNMGAFSHLDHDIRSKIYDYIVLDGTKVSILGTPELTIPAIELLSKDFQTDVKSWYLRHRNATLTSFSDVQSYYMVYSIPSVSYVQYTFDLTRYEAREEAMCLKMVRFANLYDIDVVREVSVKPIMRQEVRGGVEANEDQFDDILHMLAALESVKTISIILTSKHRSDIAKEKNVAIYENWLATRETPDCPLRSQQNCAWPAEMVWGLFAMVLVERLSLNVEVRMDGEMLCYERFFCEHVRDSRVWRELQDMIEAHQRKSGVRTRDPGCNMQ